MEQKNDNPPFGSSPVQADVSCCSQFVFILRGIMLFAAIVASTTALAAFAIAINNFDFPNGHDNECPLTVNLRNGDFGSKTPCEYTLFASVASLGLSLLLFIMIIVNLCRKRLGLTRAIGIEMIMVIVMFIVILSAAAVVTSEFKNQCDDATKGINLSCESVFKHAGKQASQFKDLYDRLAITEGALWAATACWFLYSAASVIRFWMAVKDAKSPTMPSFDNPNAFETDI
eukprot:m.7501 g.7501  ORF g.7501 m.7501 type:complete len:230 (-) comp6729_c0_seq1:46-735(-)